VQPVAFAEGAAGFAGIANERGHRFAAREYAADDLAADATGGANHCGGHDVSGPSAIPVMTDPSIVTSPARLSSQSGR
jgi:hypothetical protein